MEPMTVDLSKSIDVGENIHAVKVDGLLILVIDPSREIGLSKSGKMMGVASSGGFTKVLGDLSLNLYVGKKAQA